MVKVPRPTSHNLPKWIYFTLLYDPRLCSRYDSFREPPRESPTFQNETGSQERACLCLRARDDIARMNVGCIWIGIAQEESERHNGPGIAILVI